MRVRLVIEILHHLDVGLRALLLDDELSSGSIDVISKHLGQRRIGKTK
jgi:hypothetical protein